MIEKYAKYCKKKEPLFGEFWYHYERNEKFFSFVCKNVSNLLFFRSINKTVNMVDIAARGGHNDLLMLIKKEFSDVKGTDAALYWATKHGYDDTIILLKRISGN